ncbi:MAG: hypothetical protein ABIO65_06655 [Nitrospiria bacterium]
MVTQRILQGAERNALATMGREALAQFSHHIADAHLRVVKAPSTAQLRSVSSLIDPKDVHVPASAIAGRATSLLTLDRKHVMTSTLRRADLGLVIQTPGEFL